MIQVTKLTKKFGDLTAVDDVSFEVASGEAVALWGPNGAGKTTIIRSLLGLLSASGQLQINGFDTQRAGKRARAAVGYVPQELAFYNDLMVRETVAFYAALKGVASQQAAQVLAEVELSAHRAKTVAALSGGMKQRLALALALLAEPPLLILDEPTSNLDPTARDEFIALLQQQKSEGKTLLFTSHRLEEVEALADRVLVMKEGRLTQRCSSAAQLVEQLGVTVKLKLIIPESKRSEALRLLQRQGFAVRPNGRGLRVAVSPSAKAAPLQALLAEEIAVDNFEIENGSGLK